MLISWGNQKWEMKQFSKFLSKSSMFTSPVKGCRCIQEKSSWSTLDIPLPARLLGKSFQSLSSATLTSQCGLICSLTMVWYTDIHCFYLSFYLFELDYSFIKWRNISVIWLAIWISSRLWNYQINVILSSRNPDLTKRFI